MKISDEISKASLFNGLPAEQIEDLSRICLDQRYQKGQELFSEGSRAKGFYLVYPENSKSTNCRWKAKSKFSIYSGAARYSGKSRLLREEVTRPTPRPSNPAGRCFFPRTSFIELIGREPAIAVNLLGILSQRLRRFTHMIEDLSLKEVPGRLAAYLIYLGERSGSACKPWNSI